MLTPADYYAQPAVRRRIGEYCGAGVNGGSTSFSGLLATGLDRGMDVNCVSMQERRLCPLLPCRLDLRTSRDRVLQRISV